MPWPWEQWSVKAGQPDWSERWPAIACHIVPALLFFGFGFLIVFSMVGIWGMLFLVFAMPAIPLIIWRAHRRASSFVAFEARQAAIAQMATFALCGIALLIIWLAGDRWHALGGLLLALALLPALGLVGMSFVAVIEISKGWHGYFPILTELLERSERVR